jgi:Fe/S biogenesis protein NfuA
MNITKEAQEYLNELLANQGKFTMGIKVEVLEPGTPRGETVIAYATEEDDLSGYRLEEGYDFKVYLDEKSLCYMESSVIDYSPDNFGGTLTIKAPNAKVPSIEEDASIEQKINYVLYSEINPALASHGGEVSLHEVVNKNTAVLKFGGGCQGCGMVDVTLKAGVEKTLLEMVEGLTAVTDITDHSYKVNAYYK